MNQSLYSSLVTDILKYVHSKLPPPVIRGKKVENLIEKEKPKPQVKNNEKVQEPILVQPPSPPAPSPKVNPIYSKWELTALPLPEENLSLFHRFHSFADSAQLAIPIQILFFEEGDHLQLFWENVSRAVTRHIAPCVVKKIGSAFPWEKMVQDPTIKLLIIPLEYVRKQFPNLSFGLSSSKSEKFTPQILRFSDEVNSQRPFTSQKSTRDASKLLEFEGEKPKTQVYTSSILPVEETVKYLNETELKRSLWNALKQFSPNMPRSSSTV